MQRVDAPGIPWRYDDEGGCPPEDLSDLHSSCLSCETFASGRAFDILSPRISTQFVKKNI